MIDIHCHLLPGIDDGPDCWEESLEMARLAVSDGVRQIVATPHQLGQYRRNAGSTVRALVQQFNHRSAACGLPLQVVPGADVRIELDMLERIASGDVVTLADQRRHILLELPHEIYIPLEPLLGQLRQQGLTGILSHPERNLGILETPHVMASLIEAGCLMQVTAGSYLGAFGRRSQDLAEWMLANRMVHFVASDGHGTKRRRPRLRAAYDRVLTLTNHETARRLFIDNPQCVVDGRAIPRQLTRPARRRWTWLKRGRAAGIAR